LIPSISSFISRPFILLLSKYWYGIMLDTSKHKHHSKTWSLLQNNQEPVVFVIVGSWIYNYLSIHCLSPPTLFLNMFMSRCTRYDTICQSLSVTCDRSVIFFGY
jgi:hypothetical protein